MFSRNLIFRKKKNMANVFVRWLDIYTGKIILALLIVCFSLVLVFQPPIWIFDTLDALRIPYAIALTAFTIFMFIRSNKLLATSGALALAILAPGIWQYFKTGQAPVADMKQEIAITDTSTHFSAVHFNVKENNKNISSVAQAALESGADILSFQEMQQRTLEPLDAVLKEQYPYKISDLSRKGYGMAVYAKYPIGENKTVVQHDFPLLTGVIHLPGNTIRIISATTSSPKNEKGYNEQLKQLKVISAYADTVQLPLLVMGDMNAVPWSEQIENFQKETKLKDSRKNLSSTFPSNSIIQVPIDYIFYSPDLHCIEFKTLEQTSSNHLGIIGYYTFGQKKKGTNAGENRQ